MELCGIGGVRRIVSLNRAWTSCDDEDYEVLGTLVKNGLHFEVNNEKTKFVIKS